MRPNHLLVVEHEHDAGPALLREAAERSGLTLELVRPAEGDDVPGSAGDYAGVVVLGGSMGATESSEHPHLASTQALLREVARAGPPALCICLGAQLAALALGGTVQRRAAGFEIGWYPVELAPGADEDPVVGALARGGRLFQWHQDEFVAPPGSTVLLYGRDGSHQAFRAGPLLAVQAHPEVNAEAIAGWAESAEGGRDLRSANTTAPDVEVPRDGSGLRLIDAWLATLTA